MSDLAFNANGDGFEVPAAVTAWRVRRMKPRGAPELVYGRDGRPLTVSIECDIDELREAVGANGRYRLDPIDDHGKVVEGVPAAYVQVLKQERDSEPATGVMRGEPDGVLREALRMNTELAKSVVERFPEMMHAAAELLRAADGAGLPARRPHVIDVESDEDEMAPDEVPVVPQGFDLNALVGQLAPMLVTAITSGKLKVPGLGALFDWRKAAQPSEVVDAEPRTAKAAKARPRKEEPASTAQLPPIDPAMMGHFIAIQATLSTDEAAKAREIAGELSPAEMRAWIDELGKLSVPDAAAKIRKVISGNKEAAS